MLCLLVRQVLQSPAAARHRWPLALFAMTWLRFRAKREAPGPGVVVWKVLLPCRSQGHHGSVKFSDASVRWGERCAGLAEGYGTERSEVESDCRRIGCPWLIGPATLARHATTKLTRRRHAVRRDKRGNDAPCSWFRGSAPTHRVTLFFIRPSACLQWLLQFIQQPPTLALTFLRPVASDNSCMLTLVALGDRHFEPAVAKQRQKDLHCS